MTYAYGHHSRLHSRAARVALGAFLLAGLGSLAPFRAAAQHSGAAAVDSGTLTFTSAGIYSVTAAASDGALIDSHTFTWTVTGVDRLPVLSAVADRTDLENATVSLPLVATDPDGDALTYTATGLPGGLGVAYLKGTDTL